VTELVPLALAWLCLFLASLELARRVRADFLLSSLSGNPSLTPDARSALSLPPADAVPRLAEAVDAVDDACARAGTVVPCCGRGFLRRHTWRDGVFRPFNPADSDSASSRSGADAPSTTPADAGARSALGTPALSGALSRGGASPASALALPLGPGGPAGWTDLPSAAEAAASIMSPGARPLGRDAASVAASPAARALGLVASPAAAMGALARRMRAQGPRRYDATDGDDVTAALAELSRRTSTAAGADRRGERQSRFALAEYLSPERRAAPRFGSPASRAYAAASASDAWAKTVGAAGAAPAADDEDGLTTDELGVLVVPWPALPRHRAAASGLGAAELRSLRSETAAALAVAVRTNTLTPFALNATKLLQACRSARPPVPVSEEFLLRLLERHESLARYDPDDALMGGGAGGGASADLLRNLGMDPGRAEAAGRRRLGRSRDMTLDEAMEYMILEAPPDLRRYFVFRCPVPDVMVEAREAAEAAAADAGSRRGPAPWRGRRARPQQGAEDVSWSSSRPAARRSQRELSLWQDKAALEGLVPEVPSARSRTQGIRQALGRLEAFAAAGQEAAGRDGIALRDAVASVSDDWVVMEWFERYMNVFLAEFARSNPDGAAAPGASGEAAAMSALPSALTDTFDDGDDPFGDGSDAATEAAAPAAGFDAGAGFDAVGGGDGGGYACNARPGARTGRQAPAGRFTAAFTRTRPPQTDAEAEELVLAGCPVIVKRSPPGAPAAAGFALSVVRPGVDAETGMAIARRGVEVRCPDALAAIGLFSAFVHREHGGRLGRTGAPMPAAIGENLFGEGGAVYESVDREAADGFVPGAAVPLDPPATAMPEPTPGRSSSSPRRRRRF